MSNDKVLTNYYLLGKSGLRVSPLCLGTMTFGTEWGWGSPLETVRAMLTRYLEAGGNFIDTADGYTNGKSEEMIGQFIKDTGLRDRVVIATKFTFNTMPGNPNAGGNGRKNIRHALEGSLRRLQSDYVDLYWLHCWDHLTPIEEVISTLHDLVREGKVRYLGFSNVPAWYLSRCQTMAELRGWEKICALQMEYSLVERHIEAEHVPAAIELGMGICPWSPLASGFLTGKYHRQDQGKVSGEGRLQILAGSGNPAFEKFTDRNWNILDAVLQVSQQLGQPPSQIALNWVSRRPGVTSTIIGATKLAQLDDNLNALSFTIPSELLQQLDKASELPSIYPYTFFQPGVQNMISGGTNVQAEPYSYRF